MTCLSCSWINQFSFQVGIDDFVSLVPFYGDLLSGILQLYQVFLSCLFGLEYGVVGCMVSLIHSTT